MWNPYSSYWWESVDYLLIVLTSECGLYLLTVGEGGCGILTHRIDG